MLGQRIKRWRPGRKNRIGVALALSSLLIVAACGSGADDASAEGDTIVVGASISLTGEFADQGERTVHGYEMWRDAVNEAGGLKVGDKTYQVKLVVLDDRSDPQLSAQLTERLITEENAQFLLGPFSSAISLQTTAIAERHRVITMSTGGNSTDIYTRGFKYVFSVLVPAANNQWGVLSVIRTLQQSGKDLKTVAILAKDDAFGHSVADGIRQRIKAGDPNLEIVYDQTYPINATDLQTLLTQAKAADPDIVLTASHDDDGVLLVKQARELGFAPDMMAVGIGLNNKSFRDALGDLANGLFGTSFWEAGNGYSDPLFGDSQKFADRYVTKYGKPITGYNTAAAATGAQILGIALERAGTLDSDAVREQLLKFDVETTWGKVTFDETGQNAGGEPAAIQFVDGTVKVTQSAADVVVPMPGW